MPNIVIDDDLVVNKGPNNTWTLATQLGRMLAKAEDQYGRRDESFTILGVEFRDDGPQIWFPVLRKASTPEQNRPHEHVVVQLATSTVTNRNLAIFQLAQEWQRPSDRKVPRPRLETYSTAFSPYCARTYRSILLVRVGDL